MTSRSSTAESRFFLTGALLWCLCVQFFITERIARNAWKTPYSWWNNFISDLGAVQCANRAVGYVCSPLHNLMNGSFILQGILIVGGGMLLSHLFPNSGIGNIARFLIFLAGASVALVGLAPEDGLPAAHFIAAAIHLTSGNLGMIFLGAANSANFTRSVSLITMAAGSIGLIALLLLVLRAYGPLGVGGIERIAAYPFPLWLTGMGILLVRKRSSYLSSAN